MLNMNNIPAYELIRQEKLPSLNTDGYLLKHKKTGARICLLSNQDTNKVFNIGFRTPPSTHTGVPHIIEHTVLCGSKKYPVKDPFVELVKGSLNTFLNAMTYPDKTIYPVASYNDKDFQNLMNVYLDAVFYPNLYDRKEIFMQEGWHYEMENEDAPLTINGVVYNEMKGAYSSPDEVLYSSVQKALFPDTCYGKDSGGDPKYIPTLTREAYLDFHRSYYHPVNSYIYLYGDMDMEEKLNFIDEQYLSHFEPRKIDSEIPTQKAFEKPVDVTKSYSISSEESTKNKTIFAYGAVTGDCLDKETYIALSVINYYLMSRPGAPLKQALLDAGIGNDISGYFDNSMKQPMYVIAAKNTEAEKLDAFKKTINDTLTNLVKNGLDKSALEAGLNVMEFKYREGDFGNAPKGLIYIIQSMDSWLYDENDPFKHIEAGETYKALREKINTDYFEQLIQKVFLDNNHEVYVTLTPEKGLSVKEDEALAKELADRKSKMSKEEIKEIVEQTKALKKYQSEPSTPEELLSIPMLKRGDIKKEPLELKNNVKKDRNVTILHHDIVTNGIHYLRFMFDVKRLNDELLPYVGLLMDVWGLLDTKNYTYEELSNEIDRTTGGIGASFEFIESFKQQGRFDLKFMISAKTFYEKAENATKLIGEIIENTNFDSEKRLRELIGEARSRLQDDIVGAGNRYGVLRANSYLSRSDSVRDDLMGIGYYEFLANLDDNFDKEKDTIIARLKMLNNFIFRQENLVVSSTCTKDEFDTLEEKLHRFYGSLKSDFYEVAACEPSYEKLNEGVMTASQVQYVCQVGNFKEAGFDYTGAMAVLKMILSYDYLWLNVRVQGGAYGCSGGLNKTGYMALSSYRDPNLKDTLKVYSGIPKYLRDFKVDEREMTKYVIGTIGMIDTPLTPRAEGLRSAVAYLRGTQMEDIIKERRQILECTPEDIQALAEPVEAALSQNYVCVIGNEEKIKQDKDCLMNLKTL